MQKLDQAILDQYVSQHGEKALRVLFDPSTSKYVMVKAHDQSKAQLIELEGRREYEVESSVMLKMGIVIRDEAQVFQLQILADSSAFKHMNAPAKQKLSEIKVYEEQVFAATYFCVTGEISNI